MSYNPLLEQLTYLLNFYYTYNLIQCLCDFFIFTYSFCSTHRHGELLPLFMKECRNMSICVHLPTIIAYHNLQLTALKYRD